MQNEEAGGGRFKFEGELGRKKKRYKNKIIVRTVFRDWPCWRKRYLAGVVHFQSLASPREPSPLPVVCQRPGHPKANHASSQPHTHHRQPWQQTKVIWNSWNFQTLSGAYPISYRHAWRAELQRNNRATKFVEWVNEKSGTPINRIDWGIHTMLKRKV